jgi:hypothetical protein
MKNVASFIDTTITAMESHKGSNGAIAKYLNAINHESPLNRIAIAFTQLNNQRKNDRLETLRSGVPVESVLVCKPERLLSFCQNIMNQCCWAALRVSKAGKKEDLANGLDFSQDVAEQAGNIASSSAKDIKVTLDDDWNGLSRVQGWMAEQYSYLTEIEPVYMYSESEQRLIENSVSTEYVVVFQSMEMDDIFTYLNDKAEQLAADSDAAKTEEATSTDFTAKAA